MGDAAPRRPRHKPAIKAVPPSGLLGRLQAFLPTLEAANANLQQQLDAGGGEQVAMERGSDDEREGPYVEMDLACGLFDLKDPSAVAAAEAAMVGRGVAVEAYGAGSSDDSSDGSSDGSGSEGEGDEGGEERMRQALGIVAAAQQQHPQQRQGGEQQAAAAAAAGGDAMEEDAPAQQPSNGAAPAEAAPADGVEDFADRAAAAAATGRRRRHKVKGRHAGIVELS